MCRISQLTLAFLGAWAVGHHLAAPALAQPVFDTGVAVGSLNSTALNEVSGLAASRVNPGVLWCHNDSGDSPRFFAIDHQARLLGTFTLPGAIALDYEDIAVGPGPAPGVSYLYVGDIGDNLAFRPSVRVYRVVEPTVALSWSDAPPTLASGSVASVSLTYPDGPRDAEALLIDPVTGALLIITKSPTTARVYSASAAEIGGLASVALAFERDLPLGATGRRITAGDVSSDGRLIILRGLGFALLYTREPGETLAAALGRPPTPCPVIGPPLEPQGEAIAFDAAAHGYFTVSEGVGALLYRFARQCRADHNGRDGVTVQDVYDFLSDWQNRRLVADFNGDPPDVAEIGVQDLYDFLTAWNTGCP